MHLFVVDLFMILQFMYLFTFESLEDFANLMTMLPTYIMCIVKTVNLFYKMKKIYELFALIEQTYTTGLASKISFRHVEHIYKVFIAFWLSAVMSCVVGGIGSFKSRELPYRMWLPNNGLENELVFWCSAIYATVNTTCLSGVDIVLDVLPVFFMSYVLEMLEEVCEQLEEIKSPREILSEDIGSNPETNRDKLIKCVKLHLRAVDIAQKVEEVFATALFVRGLMSTLIFCTTAFALTVVSFLHLYILS
jgi:7tm Odorant receptor